MASEPTSSPYAMAKLTAIEMGDALKQQYGHKIINNANKFIWTKRSFFRKR